MINENEHRLVLHPFQYYIRNAKTLTSADNRNKRFTKLTFHRISKDLSNIFKELNEGKIKLLFKIVKNTVSNEMEEVQEI